MNGKQMTARKGMKKNRKPERDSVSQDFSVVEKMQTIAWALRHVKYCSPPCIQPALFLLEMLK